MGLALQIHVILPIACLILVTVKAATNKLGGSHFLIGNGGCRGEDWDSGDWPKAIKGDKSLDDCSHECLADAKCTGFHLVKARGGKQSKTQAEASQRRPCFLFGHEDYVAVKALGGECYQIKRLKGHSEAEGKNTKKKADKEPIDRGNSRTKPAESKGKVSKGKYKKDGDDDNDEDEKVDKIKENKKKSKPPTKPTDSIPKEHKTDSKETKSQSAKSKTLPDNAKKVREGSLEEGTSGHKQYDGKYLIEVGKGGCRGPNWNKKHCPKDLGRKNIDECAEGCLKSEFCTAFHVLKPEADGKFDCLLFGHREVIAVKGLGGFCYTFSDTPPGAPEEQGQDDEDTPIPVEGPVTPLLVGRGRCRGPKWTSKNWPIGRGRLPLDKCARECAQKRGCTSFDTTNGDGVFDCWLYGHKDVSPASGVEGSCYVLRGSPQEKILSLSEETEEDENEDDTEDTDSLGELKFWRAEGGEGVCRGEGWQRGRKWPKVRGLVDGPETCASECWKTKGCHSFDLSIVKTEEGKAGQSLCHLYPLANPRPASGVKGQCYVVGKGGTDLSDEAQEHDELPSQDKDASPLSQIPKKGPNYSNLGRGLCRGDNWQDENKVWPKEGEKDNFDDCLKICLDDVGCTAFDATVTPNSKKLKCTFYGHDNVRRTNSVSLNGRCIKMLGRKSIPTQGEEKGSEEGHFSLGKGLCRGENWQSKEWPKYQGLVTKADCFSGCHSTTGCTAYDTRDPVEDKAHCYLFGHSDVRPASGLKGECFKMAKRGGNGGGPSLIGKGACRGPGWQDGKNWPVVMPVEVKGIEACGQACAKQPGCTAFDVRPDGSACLLYGHATVIPASGVPGDCYWPPQIASPGLEAKLGVNGGKKKKSPKVPEFKAPIIEEPIEEDDDDDWLFEPPPPVVRSRLHVDEALAFDNAEGAGKLVEQTLKELKTIYENSVKPLEDLYAYKELSNRHFGDPEIFAKPLVVLMGPWSGGKSTMINYLLGTEYTKNAFKSGAEPSPGFNFNIAMHGDTEEELDGTQLSAEWTFSSLQKFGQEFLKKLQGKKLPNKLLEKATFAEIPGVLETGTKRKVDRLYNFNEACQWFIDHADLILLVYDYTKLDIGPETEALLDQLKGRESQVRIILNKADEITAEELLKIQGNLVWNVSPHMASLEPPTMYAGSFWSRPYHEGAPKKLLKAQEMSLLKDIKAAVVKRVENRINTARRFAVRVRNHAKMVDVYVTTFNSRQRMFGNKKKIADDIVENPDNYHIYDGISTMTNISRFDLPDPKTYRTFFGIHPLDKFPTLQSTCTYFRGCPINKLDQAIAYQLPDLLTKFKRKLSQGPTNTKDQKNR